MVMAAVSSKDSTKAYGQKVACFDTRKVVNIKWRLPRLHLLNTDFFECSRM